MVIVQRFRDELCHLIGRSKEIPKGIPEGALADYLIECIESYQRLHALHEECEDGEAEELAREMENCSTNTIAPTKQWAARVRSLPRLADAAPLVEALGRAEWYWFNAEEDAACWYVCPDCGATSDDRKTAKHYAECIIDAALTTYRKQTGATPE